MINSFKDKIGMKSTVRNVTLSLKEMKDFATCIKATVGNTVHTPLTSISIPTLFTVFRLGEFEIINGLGIQLSQVLHAEQEYKIVTPLHPGEELHYQTSLAEVLEKKGKGAKLAFLEFQTDFIRTHDSALLAVAKSTMVYRDLK